MNGCNLSPMSYAASTENVVSFQMCPDFTGSPFYPENQQVKYEVAPIFPCKDFGMSRFRTLTRTVGGGVTETFAFGGAAPRDQSGGGLGGSLHFDRRRARLELQLQASIKVE